MVETTPTNIRLSPLQCWHTHCRIYPRGRQKHPVICAIATVVVETMVCLFGKKSEQSVYPDAPKCMF